jgi:addiction module HigA family antidote
MEVLVRGGNAPNRMAMDLRVPVTRIADIVNERRGVTADTALRFARYFRNAPAFWMNLQTRYDLEVAEDKERRELHGMCGRWRPAMCARARCASAKIEADSKKKCPTLY